MSLVLDSSVTIAWIYAEEVTTAIGDVFKSASEKGAWVPALWRLEVGNVLQMGVRSGRHNVAFRDATFDDLSRLPISTDGETDRQAWTATARLAEAHKLTFYDAAYLELAKRRNLALATLDEELRAAAMKEGIALLGL
jgi:predicted nucleic acid-binding protein